MLPVPAKCPSGLEPCLRHRRADPGIGPVGRACRPILIGRLPRPKDLPIGGAATRGAAVRVTDACKFLFFPRRPASTRSTCGLASRFCAALRDALVNNNENTSAKLSASGRAATQPAELPRENGAHRPVPCNTRGRRTSPTTSAQQAGTRGRGTRAARRQPRRAARGSVRLRPAAIVNRCRSLLIARHRERSETIQELPARLWIASSPNGAPRGACAAGTPGRLAMTLLDLHLPSASAGACKFLFFHARRSRAQALRAPTAGSPRPPTALVNPCRSLLIAQIPGAAEPVRSGDRPVRRHGLSFPPPPPSAREESGERP
jgi:hypothetical protein